MAVEASTTKESWALGEGYAGIAAFENVSFKRATEASWASVKCKEFRATLIRALGGDMVKVFETGRNGRLLQSFASTILTLVFVVDSRARLCFGLHFSRRQ